MSKTFTLLLEPIDVLSFRDYRGLESGEQHDVDTVFPTPTVMLGAVRGALFRAAGADFNEISHQKYQGHYGVDERYRDWLGGPEPEEPFALTVRGPWLVRDLHNNAPTLWLPQPLIPNKGGVFHPDKHVALTPHFHGPVNRAASLFLKPPGDKDDPDEEGARFVLASDLGRICPERGFFERERRVGIARKLNTRTVEAGLFYLQDTLRFAEGVGLAVEVNTLSPDHIALLQRLDGQAIPLGGRGHHVRVKVVPEIKRPTQSPYPTRGVWCVTPMPLHPTQGLVLPPGAKLEALYTKEALVVGGFDRAHRRPHPLIRVLPAGTVITLSGAPGDLTQHDWGLRDDPPTRTDEKTEPLWFGNTLKRAGFGVTQLLGDTAS